MRRLLVVLALVSAALTAGCDTMPEEDPGYEVRRATPPRQAPAALREADAAAPRIPSTA
jgi:hypothetical protein